MYSSIPTTELASLDFSRLLDHTLGNCTGYLCIASANPDKTNFRQQFFKYPSEGMKAIEYVFQQDAQGRNVWYCAHLLSEPIRKKAYAVPVTCLWADVDTADPHGSYVHPTAVVETSPGRFQAYLGLDGAEHPEIAEYVNQRWTWELGADKSGYDLTQLLRVPGTHNHKYFDSPIVKLVEINENERQNLSVLQCIWEDDCEPEDTPIREKNRRVKVNIPANIVVHALDTLCFPVDYAGHERWHGRVSFGSDRSSALYWIGDSFAKFCTDPMLVAGAIKHVAKNNGQLDKYENRDGEYYRIAKKAVEGYENAPAPADPYPIPSGCSCQPQEPVMAPELPASVYGRGAQVNGCMDVLLEFLKDGDKPTNDVRALIESYGLSWRSTERARERLGVTSYQRGGRWYCSLTQTARKSKKSRNVQAASSQTATTSSNTQTAADQTAVCSDAIVRPPTTYIDVMQDVSPSGAFEAPEKKQSDAKKPVETLGQRWQDVVQVGERRDTVRERGCSGLGSLPLTVSLSWKDRVRPCRILPLDTGLTVAKPFLVTPFGSRGPPKTRLFSSQ